MIIRLEGMINPRLYDGGIVDDRYFCQDLHEVSPVQGIYSNLEYICLRSEFPNSGEIVWIDSV
jgi:hypothetical protein